MNQVFYHANCYTRVVWLNLIRRGKFCKRRLCVRASRARQYGFQVCVTEATRVYSYLVY